MKSGLHKEVDTLRMVISQVRNRQIEGAHDGQKAELSDDQVLDVLQREAKKRREAIELYQKGGREELAENEQLELKIIGQYLPVQMSEDDVRSCIDELVAGGAGDFPSLMKEASARMKGKADGKLIARIAKEKIG